MAEISVIGSAWIEEAVNCKDSSIRTGKNGATISRFYSGDMRNVAHTLSQLDIHTSLCMKYGSDLESAQLWNQLNSLNIMLYGPTIDAKLPTLVSVTSNQRTLNFWDGDDSFKFLKDDLYPHAAFANSDYVVTDIQDNEVLELLIMKSPNTKWVLSRFVPNKNILSNIEGIILTYEDALQLGKATDFDRICYRLCSLGVKWIVITMGKQGYYAYSFRKPLNYHCLYKGEGYESGCYSGFIAGLLYGLATYHDFPKAVTYGCKVSAAIHEVVEATRDDIKEAIKEFDGMDPLLY